MTTFELEIATPERLLVKEQASEAQIPIGESDGEIGVLPGHAALLSQLGTGPLSYTVDGQKRTLAVSDGVVEVQPTFVRVLAMRAERPNEIDLARAKQAEKRAQERLNTVKENVDFARALNALKRAQARIATAAK